MIRDFFMALLMIFYIFMKLIFLPKKLFFHLSTVRCCNNSDQPEKSHSKCTRKRVEKFISISF